MAQWSHPHYESMTYLWTCHLNYFSQYDKIDNEHKILFQGIFNVAAARGDAGALKNLIDNVVFHFNEEQVFNFPCVDWTL